MKRVRGLLKKAGLYAFHILVVRPVLVGLASVRYRKRSRLPQGPCLVVANHNSHLDAAVLMSMFPLRRLAHVHPVAAADYFGSNWWRRALAMVFMNGIPIERRPARGEDPLAPAIEMVKAGHSLVFFPEGSRGEAGVVAPFRRGVGILVREVPGLLVVPVFLSGPERIWPRGEVVPVPLNIDAHIGKPRTFPVDGDPKEIAETLRDAVLALAPPEPPPPGRRSEPPTQIVVCGIDDERRQRVAEAIVRQLGRLGPTLGIGDTLTEADEGGTREAAGPIPVQPLGVWLRLFAWTFRLHRGFDGEAFRRRVERAQIGEALAHGGPARYVVQDGAALVDLPARRLARSEGEVADAAVNRLIQYLMGQKSIPVGATWEMVRESPDTWLISTFELVRPPLPAVLVRIRQRPDKVMERLRSRGRPLGAHARVSDLERLEEAYDTVASVLRRLHRVEVVEVDGESTPLESIAEDVSELCRARRQPTGTES